MQPLHLYAPQTFKFTNTEHLSAASFAAHVALYQAYVEQANLVLTTLADSAAIAAVAPAARTREALARRLSFETNGVLLHEFFFQQLEGSADAQPPKGGTAVAAMKKNFGGYLPWLADIKLLSESRGSGWVVTLWDGEHQRLSNAWIDLHHLSVPIGQQLMFAVDMWEHAYWSDFGAKGRAKYFDSVILSTDWKVIEQRFALLAQ